MFLEMKEVVSGLLVIFLMLTVFLIWGITFDGFIMALMVLLFCIISLYDLHRGIIPNGLIVCGILIQIFSAFIKGEGIQKIGQAFGSGLFIAGIVLLVVLVMDRILKSPSMGGGDIKLILMLGMMTTLYQSFLALCLSSIIGLILFFLSGQAKRKTMPFGPPLCAGWLIICCLDRLSFFNLWPI